MERSRGGVANGGARLVYYAWNVVIRQAGRMMHAMK